MVTTPFLGLKVWNLNTDPYDHAQLADNWARVDEHDHTPGKGKLITTAAIVDGAITAAKIDTGVAFTPASNSVGGDQLESSVDDALGLNSTGNVRRGKSIIAAEETQGGATFSLMATPDRVQNVVLPTDGLLVVGYQAQFQHVTTNVGEAAIFVGSAQLKQASSGNAVPVIQSVLTGNGGEWNALGTFAGGLTASTTSYSTDVTTGQVMGVDKYGLCYIFASAGTYDVSVQFGNGTHARNRKLWVWTIGF